MSVNAGAEWESLGTSQKADGLEMRVTMGAGVGTV